MTYSRLSVLSLALLLTGLAQSGEPVFDSHVHLREGEASLQKFEAEARTSGIELAGVGAMWFGGPHQALAGDPATIRAGNDGLISLAAKHPEVVPIGTVHPYDGQAALDELGRIAARGVKTLKIHPHTQKFDIADPRVLALTKKAGELGMAVLMDNAGIVPGDCEDLFNLAANAPKTRFIFAHIGGANFRFWNILVLARTADAPIRTRVNHIEMIVTATGPPIEVVDALYDTRWQHTCFPRNPKTIAGPTSRAALRGRRQVCQRISSNQCIGAPGGPSCCEASSGSPAGRSSCGGRWNRSLPSP
jgi:hypothetical protein